MKKWLLIPIIIATILVLQLFYTSQPEAETTPSQDTAIRVQVDPTSVLTNAQRIGINLGTWSSWGAEQLSKNIVPNPGFEGELDRVIVFVSQSDGSGFSDEKGWGYEDNYWTGATYEVRTGPSSGTTGKIKQSLRTGANALPQYFTETPPPSLSPKDVIVLTKKTNRNPVPLWWINDKFANSISVDLTEKRPGSAGLQSLSFTPSANNPIDISSFIDSDTDRLGKMLLVNGPWKISFWAKGSGQNPTLKVLLRRFNSSPAFFEQEIPLTQDWQEYSFDFNGNDTGTPATIQLNFIANGQNGKVWLDDVALGPVQPENKTMFRQEAVDLLKQLNPSYLRDTQGQLGDTYENRVADIYGRRSVNSRAYAGERSTRFLYSIPDVIQLAKTIGANPWFVIPPTFSDSEAYNFGTYLAQNANKNVFPEVIVEFGNENWNWLFKTTAIPYHEQHGVVADKVFNKIAEGAGGNVNLRKIVNGQHVAPAVSYDFLNSTKTADTLAIAPYFLYTLNSGTNDVDNLNELFKSDDGSTQQTVQKANSIGKNVAVYEVNAHTMQGNAPLAQRDGYTASNAAGAALAKRLIEDMLMKVQPQVVFTFTQYDVGVWDIKDVAKLWGVTRDLSPTKRLRPQGLVISMLNKVIGGNIHKLVPAPGITPSQANALGNLNMAAFEWPKNWYAAAVNPTVTPVEVEITFPNDGRTLPSKVQVLDSPSPFDTNEDSEKVKITTKDATVAERNVRFTIPAWGFVVLTGETTSTPVPKSPVEEPIPPPPEEPTPPPPEEPTPPPPEQPTPPPTEKPTPPEVKPTPPKVEPTPPPPREEHRRRWWQWQWKKTD